MENNQSVSNINFARNQMRRKSEIGIADDHVNFSDEIESSLNRSAENNNGATIPKEEQQMDNDPLKIYSDLEQECLNNTGFFENDNSEKGKRIHQVLNEWIKNIQRSRNLVDKVSKFMSDYDFDENTPGNGYRSFVRVTEACCVHGLKICKSLSNSRERILFRKNYYLKELESCSALQASINTCLDFLFILKECSDDGCLFGQGNVEALFEKGEIINQHSFYGRCLGFQFRKSIQGALRFISIAMASFSESYYSNGGRIAKTTSSVWTGGKYFLNPELRAKRIVNISQNASIDFCKSFWFLAESELMQAIPSIVGPTVKVNTVINIPPEAIILNSEIEKGKSVIIHNPTIHLGPQMVIMRLLSAERYKNMLGTENKQKNFPDSSDNLLFHCHGGGFVAQSSKSHELYLRDWATQIKAPILSIDYSLAPEAPFPRALDEVFFAYCYALKNAQTLGWSGRNVIVAGDSAGANLVLGVTLKCIQLGIKKPSGIFVSYCPTLVNFIPSPARLLCLMDPILPFGFLMRCLKAYTCPKKNEHNNMNAFQNAEESNNEINSNDNNIIQANANNLQSFSKNLSPVDMSSKFNGNEVMKDESITSPSSNGDSNTFASASMNGNRCSGTVENTELSPSDISSCISFEDDSQPITHMPPESMSCSKSNEKLIESEDNFDSSFQKYTDENTFDALKSEGNNEKFSANPDEKSDGEMCNEITSDEVHDSIKSKFNSAVSSLSSTLNKYIGSNQILVPTNEVKNNLKKIDALITRTPSDDLIFNVPNDPFLSPYHTSDSELAQYPRVKILTVDMDPCLDDCVMFAKKLKKCSVNVSLDIIQGLPHGFLNFTMMSSDAMEGSKICATHIAELFKSCNNDNA